MRTSTSATAFLVSAVIAASAILLLGATIATAAPVPSKFLLASHFGREVDLTTGADICTVASRDECQRGQESGAAGGFFYPQGVAVNTDPTSASYEDVYVADTVNHRVQELTAGGQFVSMFGWEVNKTKVEASAPQAERNICTAKSGDVCQAGVEGGAPGQLGQASSIAVSPANGDVYVADTAFGESGGEFAMAQRVQGFTSAGKLMLEVGKEVNETTGGNLCNLEEAGTKCKGAALRTPAAAEVSSEQGAFNFATEYGNTVIVGGPEDLLYVGDQGRVQEFTASGEPAGEISLAELSTTDKATGVAVDPVGDLFVADGGIPGVREYNASDQLQPRIIGSTNAVVQVSGLALDPDGRLGVVEVVGEHYENGESVPAESRGVLYSSAGVKISGFAPPASELFSVAALAFAASDTLYALKTSAQEVQAYTPIVFPEARTCAAEEVTATSARMCGEINSDGVFSTGFFQYGTSSSLGSQTALAFEGERLMFVPVAYQLTDLEPNQAYHYRVAAQAAVNGEVLQGQGEEMEFHTPTVAVRVLGTPTASFVKAQSAILSAAVNPEHLTTHYHFEYASCSTVAGCSSIHSTPEEESSQYGEIGATQEVRGLVPLTTYSYRFVASNELEEAGKVLGGKATSAEGTFTTGPVPAVKAITNPVSTVTPTTAIVSGVVSPDGGPATYAFELGVYAGASTDYGVVFSGSVLAESTPVVEYHELQGLQPGTTYAYRILIQSGYGVAQGELATFTTEGIAAVLTAPPIVGQLSVPVIAFPKTGPAPSLRGKAKHKRKRVYKKKRRRARPGRPRSSLSKRR
jgi:hypothetical protein